MLPKKFRAIDKTLLKVGQESILWLINKLTVFFGGGLYFKYTIFREFFWFGFSFDDGQKKLGNNFLPISVLDKVKVCKNNLGIFAVYCLFPSNSPFIDKMVCVMMSSFKKKQIVA